MSSLERMPVMAASTSTVAVRNVPDEGRGLFLVQRRRPWHCALSVVTVNERSLTTEHRFCSNDFQRIFQRSAEWCEPVVVELAEPYLTGQDPGSDRYQRVIR
jgi:hypothetical protein